MSTLLFSAVTITIVMILHESAHALAGLALGCRVESFHFWRGGILGGPRAAIWTMSNPRHELAVAIAGPTVNFLLFWLASDLAWREANLVVMLFSLLPLRGSDSLRALDALRRIGNGPRQLPGGTLAQQCVVARLREKSEHTNLAWWHDHNLSWPRTIRHRAYTESYQRCLDCGARIPYTGELVTK